VSGIPDTLAALRVPIADLRPFERNPRRGDLDAIRRSLETHGQYRPIVARQGTGEVLAGNHTLVAAVELGWTEIAATFVEVDDDQAARIVLVDNRTADRGGYDDAELAALLRSLEGGLEGTGWAPGELDRLLDDLQRGGDGDAWRDTEPEPVPATPRSKLGDLYQLGDHRLLCGDSTVADDVDRLLAGENPEMVWTDPPYGVDYHAPRGTRKGYRTRHRGPSFANDFTDRDLLYELVHGALTLAHDRTRVGGAIYLAHADSQGNTFRRAFLDAGWEFHQVLIWVKNAFVLSRQDYHWQHEPILYGWKPGAGHRWNGDNTASTVIDDDVDVRKLDKRELVTLVRQLQNERRTTVIREDRPTSADLHPTMKPVRLVGRQIANSSRRGELVYEPFGGSGTTLIACENLGRRAAAIELMPGYCDVIVDRWKRHTGREAELERRRKRARAAV
jgi:site-specific DNA-methyltransferase (adenine-specific)